MPGIEIPITLTGGTQAATDLNRVADAMARLATQEGRLTGPNARLAAARQNLQAAQTIGMPADVIQDLQIAAARAQRSLTSSQSILQEPSVMDRIGRVFASSRFGGGGALGGVMPLVGQTLTALGASAELAGPIGIAVAGVTALTKGLQALGEWAKETAEHVRTIATTAAVSGGGVAQGAALSALGLTGERAIALRQRMAETGFGQIAAARIGLGGQVPLPFGDVNTGRQLLEVVQAMRNIRDESERLRLALMLDATDLLQLAQTSRLAYTEISKIDPALKGMILTPGLRQEAADMAAQWGRVTDAFSNLAMVAGKVAIPVIATGLEAFADSLQAAGAAANLALGPLTRDLEMIYRWLHGLGGDDGGAALNDHAAAMREHSGALREGAAGGGPRARGALPPQLGGPNLQDAMERQAMRLGVF